MKRSLLIALCLVVSTLHADEIDKAASIDSRLNEIHSEIRDRYPRVQHIDAGQLTETADSEFVLFDVREQKEFDVSHIPNAIRIPPRMSAEAFFAQFGDQVADKTIILYCSVGERSSRFARRLQRSESATPYKILNLKGGIFNWHNLGKSLTNEAEVTEEIHGFDRFWSRLLLRHEFVRL